MWRHRLQQHRHRQRPHQHFGGRAVRRGRGRHHGAHRRAWRGRPRLEVRRRGSPCLGACAHLRRLNGCKARGGVAHLRTALWQVLWNALVRRRGCCVLRRPARGKCWHHRGLANGCRRRCGVPKLRGRFPQYPLRFPWGGRWQGTPLRRHRRPRKGRRGRALRLSRRWGGPCGGPGRVRMRRARPGRGRHRRGRDGGRWARPGGGAMFERLLARRGRGGCRAGWRWRS